MVGHLEVWMRVLVCLGAVLTSACGSDDSQDTAATCDTDIGQLDVTVQWAVTANPYHGIEQLEVEPVGESAYLVSASGVEFSLELPAGDYRIQMPENSEQCFSDVFEVTVEACEVTPLALEIDCWG